MNELELIADLHRDGERQGPGSPRATRRAVELAGLGEHGRLEIADIGCGTGAATLVLAQLPGAHITAIDLLEPFVQRLRARIRRRGLQDSVEARVGDMGDLPFENESLDVIWSEGAVYNIGFERGLRKWRRFLRPGGVLAVSEITWTTARRPRELETHWTEAYPEIDSAAGKLRVLEESGYSPMGYFILPVNCWLDHYYRPLEARFDAFVARHDGDPTAREIVGAEKREIDLFERHHEYFGYGFYLARRFE